MTRWARRFGLVGAVLMILVPMWVTPASASLPKSATSTVLSVDTSSLVAGQPVRISVTVTGAVAIPTGTVTVKAGTATVGKIVLATGMAGSGSLTTATLPVGTDVLTASFAATGQFSASTSPAVTIGVTKATSRVALTSSNLNSVAGEAVTLQATVTVAAPSLEPVKGSVKFYAGTKALGSAATVGGVATLTTATLPVGAYELTASYQGTTRILPSTSDPETTSSTKTSSAVTLTVSNATPTVGQSVTLHATVTVPAPSNEPVKGSVKFYAGTKAVGTAATVSGVATLTTTSLPLGAYGVTASYLGTTRISPSTSLPIAMTVTSPSAQPSISGLSPSSGPMAGGTVVTVTGSGLTGTVGVALNTPTGAAAGTASFTVVSDSELTIVMPATTTPGWVHVSIFTTTANTGAFVPADQFTYL